MPISPYDGYTAGSNWIRANQPVVVTNVSALRALDKTKISYAVTKGYYTEGDGGAGEYWYDSSDTTSTDNGGTVIKANDDGRWKLCGYSMNIPAEKFGLLGNDSFSNDAVFSQYKVYCENNSVPIIFGTGKFKFNSGITLNQNNTIIGCGQGATVIKMYGSSAVTSNRDGVVDNVEVQNISIINSGSAVVGLDIGTLRRSLIQNVYVGGFKTGVSLDIGVSGVANYWNRLLNVTSDGTGRTASGSSSFLLGNNRLTTYPDTDYNVLIGCKSYNSETALNIVNAIGCKIIAHHAVECGTALTFVSGNNNTIDITAENCSSMGTAGSATISNMLNIYNDGGVASRFLDSGMNTFYGGTFGEQVCASYTRQDDRKISDRINYAGTGLLPTLFTIVGGSTEFAANIKIVYSGYTECTLDFSGVCEVDIQRSGSSTPTITYVRTTGGAFISAEPSADGSVAFKIPGNSTQMTVANFCVEILSIGTTQSYPYVYVTRYMRNV